MPSDLNPSRPEPKGDVPAHQPKLLASRDPFGRTSAIFLVLNAVVVVYTLVLLAIGDQPAELRGLGAVALLAVFWIWFRIHQDDADLMWTSVFEAMALVTIGLGVGDVLMVVAVFYNGLYFRSLRGGIARAVMRSAAFSAAYFGVLYLLPPTVGFSRIDLFISMTIAFPLVAATMGLLGAGLRQSGIYQRQLGEARDVARENHRKLAEAEHIAKVGSWEWDVGTGVASFSDGYLAVVGGPVVEPTLDGVLSVVVPEDRERAHRAIRRARAKVGHTVEVEYRIALPGGETRVTFSRLRAVNEPERSRTRVTGTIQDITDMRELSTELARQQEVSEMKSRFLSTVSHELRTPLTALVGFTEAMLTDDLDEPTRDEFLGLMRQQGLELSMLIEDLITFGRAEAGELALEPISVDLEREIRSVLPGLGSRGEDIVVDVDFGLSVVGDALRVRQIVRNLLDNALKYGAGPIEVTARRVDDRVVCQVSDGGPGIGPEHVDVIFEPYRRLVDDNTMGLPGVGLGLPLSRMLAEQQHGSLDYVAGGRGATFELVLPAARVVDATGLATARA